VEDRFGRHRRLELEVRQAADPREGVSDLLRLRLQLRFVREILEAAAAAGGEVRAGRVDPRRACLTRARTVSPGSPRRTKTTKPFRRATPFPPKASESIRSSSSWSRETGAAIGADHSEAPCVSFGS
jgi:hypothetical protein